VKVVEKKDLTCGVNFCLAGRDGGDWGEGSKGGEKNLNNYSNSSADVQAGIDRGSGDEDRTGWQFPRKDL